MADISGPHCIPPADVEKFWGLVGERIAEALRRGGAGTPVDAVRRDLEAGKAHLWLAIEGTGIAGVAVTALVVVHGVKRCELVAFAGQFERCRAMLPRLEQFARDEECALMRVIGRPGWSRALEGYSEPFVTLDRRL